MEKKTSSAALSMWFSTTRFIKHLRPSFTTPNQSEDKSTACKQLNRAIQAFTGENTVQQSWTTSILQHYEPSAPILNTITGLIAQTGKWEENKTPKLCRMEKDTAKHNVEENYGHDPTIE